MKRILHRLLFIIVIGITGTQNAQCHQDTATPIDNHDTQLLSSADNAQDETPSYTARIVTTCALAYSIIRLPGALLRRFLHHLGRVFQPAKRLPNTPELREQLAALNSAQDYPHALTNAIYHGSPFVGARAADLPMSGLDPFAIERGILDNEQIMRKHRLAKLPKTKIIKKTS